MKMKTNTINIQSPTEECCYLCKRTPADFARACQAKHVSFFKGHAALLFDSAGNEVDVVHSDSETRDDTYARKDDKTPVPESAVTCTRLEYLVCPVCADLLRAASKESLRFTLKRL